MRGSALVQCCRADRAGSRPGIVDGGSVKAYRFTDSTEVIHYWTDLEFVSTRSKRQAARSKHGDSEEPSTIASEAPEAGPAELLVVPEAADPRSWSYLQITPQQRLVRALFCFDTASSALTVRAPQLLGTMQRPPTLESPETAEIALKTGLSAVMIWRFYEKESAREKRKRKQAEEDEEEEEDMSEEESEETPRPRPKKTRKRRGRKKAPASISGEEEEVDAMLGLPLDSGLIEEPQLPSDTVPESGAATHAAAFLATKRRRQSEKRRAQALEKEKENEAAEEEEPAADRPTKLPIRLSWTAAQEMQLMRLYAQHYNGGQPSWEAIGKVRGAARIVDPTAVVLTPAGPGDGQGGAQLPNAPQLVAALPPVPDRPRDGSGSAPPGRRPARLPRVRLPSLPSVGRSFVWLTRPAGTLLCPPL